MTADKKLIKKSEKYITERISRKGTHSLQVEIRKDGQTFRKSLQISDFPTPGAALAAAVALRDSVLHDLRIGKAKQDLNTVKQIYDRTFELFPVRMKTKERHDGFYRYGIAAYGDMPVNKLTSADIQTSLNKYGETHSKRACVGLLAVWRRIYAACALLDLPVTDRTVGVTVPEGIPVKHRQKDISLQDLETFLAALLEYNAASPSGSYNGQSLYYAIRVMQHTGIRPQECFALTRADIDLDKNRILINKSVRSTVTDLKAISNTKTEKSVRAVPVPYQLRPILTELLAWAKYDYLFARYDGSVPDIDSVDMMIRAVRQKCGGSFTLYQLRHQFSTDLLAAGTNPAVVRDLMGHESAGQSVDYATSKEKDREKAINDRKFS